MKRDTPVSCPLTRRRTMTVNPKSLKNLKPFITPENAREAQLKGVAAKKANKLAREELKMSIRDFNEYKEVLKENEMSALDVLNIQMRKALASGDDVTAVDIAKSLAEFEAPKLARVESTNTELTAGDLSDAEIDRRLKEYADGKK